jgi:hypothetical protein
MASSTYATHSWRNGDTGANWPRQARITVAAQADYGETKLRADTSDKTVVVKGTDAQGVCAEATWKQLEQGELAIERARKGRSFSNAIKVFTSLNNMRYPDSIIKKGPGDAKMRRYLARDLRIAGIVASSTSLPSMDGQVCDVTIDVGGTSTTLNIGTETFLAGDTVMARLPTKADCENDDLWGNSGKIRPILEKANTIKAVKDLLDDAFESNDGDLVTSLAHLGIIKTSDRDTSAQHIVRLIDAVNAANAAMTVGMAMRDSAPNTALEILLRRH